MSFGKLPNPYDGDKEAIGTVRRAVADIVSDYDISKYDSTDYFYRYIRKFTMAERRAVRDELAPYIAQGWAHSEYARASYNVLAGMRAPGVDVSSVVDAVELSMTDADDVYHKRRLFNKLANLLAYLLSENQVDDLVRFFELQEDDLINEQWIVLYYGVRKKWFREEPRFAFLADDERFDEKMRAKLRR